MVAVRPGAVDRQRRLLLPVRCPLEAGEGGGSHSSATGSGSACSLRRSLPEVADEVLELAGRAERRSRLLPARAVVCFVLALFLFSSSDSSGPPGYPGGPADPGREAAAPAGRDRPAPARKFGPHQSPPGAWTASRSRSLGSRGRRALLKTCGSAREARGGRSFPLDPVRVTE
ncbi:transposase domain-containing protein [Streptomyces sp. NPDC058272]|uniref:transposase domain-containing protein n=1 Tax=Streptomyces sp. NPDC058272 TaxID=3346415 RepID=UPI0036EFBA5D